MKYIITEGQLKKIIDVEINDKSKKNLQEEDLNVRGTTNTKIKTMPTINFNLLPQSAYNTGVFADNLHKAGWPKEMNNPVTDDKINFDRYYTISSYSEQGEAMYSKKPKAPNPQYILGMPLDKGFDKFPCIKQYYDRYYTGASTKSNGIIDVILVGGKGYYPDGTVSPSFIGGTSKGAKSKYYCSGGKVIDNFTKNPKSKLYPNGNPFIKDSNGQTIIPWYVKDPQGNNFVAKLQSILIDRKLLNIAKPTGYLGNMTKMAIEAAEKTYGNSSSNVRGITKEFYDRMVNLKKGQ